jgi:hypothetical protein
MPREKGLVVENSFIAGLISDSTALNFPTNACTETDNCIFSDTGRVTRRFGFDLESNFSTQQVTKTDAIITTFVWTEVNGSGTTNIFVVQVGTTLYFYDLSFSILSSGIILDTVDLLDFDVSGATSVSSRECSFAKGAGVLFVCHPQCEPFYVTYDPAGPSVTASQITIKIRDLAGVDDGLAVDDRPTATVSTMTATHKYNLFNQGWYFNGNAALTAWDSAFTTVPSNADIWWVYKGSSDTFDSTTVANRQIGNSPAPRGHYILEAFNQDRSTVSGVAGISTVSTNPWRPTVVGFFAGRAWYAGVAGGSQNTLLYYSRLIENLVRHVGQCYMDNDPTSEELSDVLPTDGGIINIQGIGTIFALKTMGSALLAFASNGIWSVTGSQGLGFIATDYAVNKVSSVIADGYSNFVEVDGTITWWNPDGIYQISTQDGVNFQVQSLTDFKIRKYMDANIPNASRRSAVGAYNPTERTIHWLFRDTEPSSPSEIKDFNKVLIYNVLTKAFYVWSLNQDHEVKLNGILAFKGSAGDSAPIDVVNSGGDLVQTSGGDQVITYDISGSLAIPTYSYVVTYYDGSNWQMSIAKCNDVSYTDWPSYTNDTPYSYTSTFTTGYRLEGQAYRFFQPNYVFIYLETEEASSCYVQGVFDFTTAGDSNKWSTSQQIYNASLLFRNTNFRRLKVRGKGRSMQLRFESEGGKPFTIIGWAIPTSANADV